MGTLQPGQRVKFLNDVGSATVVRIEGATVVVEDEDGFERSVDQAELLIAPDPEEEAKQYGDTIPDVAQLLAQEVGEKRMRELQKDFEVRYQNAQATSMARRDAHMEVDLHIHELVDDQSGLPDRAKLAIQMDHFDRMMDIAKREKLRESCSSTASVKGCSSPNPHVVGTTSSRLLVPRRRSPSLRIGGHRGVVGAGLLAQARVTVNLPGPLSSRPPLVGRAVRVRLR